MVTKKDASNPSPAHGRCAAPGCDEPLPPPTGERRGRTRKYCSAPCRKRTHRRQARASGHPQDVPADPALPREPGAVRPALERLAHLHDDELAALAALAENARASGARLDAPAAATGPSPAPVAATAAPPRPAPARAPDGTWAPTDEQEAILAAAVRGTPLSVTAGAGTGKTALIVRLARALPGQGLYLAFNRSTAAEARTRMPDHVTSSTAHALAWKAVGHRYRSRLEAPRVPHAEVAQHLGITAPLAVTQSVLLSPAALAAQVMAMVRRYSLSDAEQIGPRHAARVPGLDAAENRRLAEHLVPLARAAWADLTRPGAASPLRLTHDHYLKMWALTRPRLEADFIALDEAQDTAPVLAAVVAAQDAQQIVVGDAAQTIYGWRGASGDLLATWPGAEHHTLSHSWRFGQRVADVANLWLEQVGTPLRLTGDPARDSTVGPCARPDAVLARTNTGAMTRALELLAQGRKVAMAGGTTAVRSLVEAAYDLRQRRRTDHPDLMGFTTWDQVRDYVEQAPLEAGELASLVRLLREHTHTAVLAATGRMTPEADAEVVCSTAHKAKGRQWGSVAVAPDFTEPVPAAEGVPGAVPRTEAMLAYVTVTRARDHLDDAGLAWIRDRATVPRRRPAAPPAAPAVFAAIPWERHTGPAPRRPVQPWPTAHLNLKGRYTTTLPGDGEPTTITPRITVRVQQGAPRTIITGLHPLLAHKLAALDEYTRPHVEELLRTATIAITPAVDDGPTMPLLSTRDRGRLITTYPGHSDLTTDDVLDLAEHLRALFVGAPSPATGPAPVPAPQQAPTRASLREEAVLLLGSGPPLGLTPDDVVHAVLSRHGLTALAALSAAEVDEVLGDAGLRAARATREDLYRDIARYLGNGSPTDVDPEAVVEAVIARHGLTTWESLTPDQVTAALDAADRSTGMP